MSQLLGPLPGTCCQVAVQSRAFTERGGHVAFTCAGFVCESLVLGEGAVKALLPSPFGVGGGGEGRVLSDAREGRVGKGRLHADSHCGWTAGITRLRRTSLAASQAV